MMNSSEDSRPFVALRQDVEDFKRMFDADIENCIALLDSKITSLICDPDSLGNPFGEAKRESALQEFSRAKYEVFISTKNFFNEIEEKWTQRISEMKNLFLENVEIFLAGTKLEVKFPSGAIFSRSGTKKNAVRNSKNEKRDSISSFSPFISSITKNLQAISVPLLGKSSSEDEKNISEDIFEDDYEVTSTRKKSARGSVKRNTYAHPPKEENITEQKLLEKSTFAQTPKKVTFMIDDSNYNSDCSSSREMVNKPTRRRSEAASLPDRTFEDLDFYDTTPSRNSSRRKTMFSEAKQEVLSDRQSEIASLPDKSFEDLDLPDITPRRNSSRRKTMFSKTEQEALSDLNVTPGRASRSQAKRKTIASASSLKSESSPKRLKVSESKGKGRTKANLLECDDDDDDDDKSDSDDKTENYTEWMPLKMINGNTPTCPGIYELKVWRAKKSAFIGSSDNLRQKLTLHKLGQNSGNKHLDKFLERNSADVQVRYEAIPSFADAKVEVKNRINNFVAQYKTTPAYN